MVCGQLKQDIEPVSRADATVSTVMFGILITFGQPVEQLAAVRQYV
jgi:hypothetical protein